MATDYDQLVKDAYAGIGRTGVGSATNQIDPEGLAYWVNQAQTNNWSPQQFSNIFGNSVAQYMGEKPQDRYSQGVADYLVDAAYGDIGRTGVGATPQNVDQGGRDYWRNELLSGTITPSQFQNEFDNAVTQYIKANPADPVSRYVQSYLGANPSTQLPVTMNYLQPGGTLQQANSNTGREWGTPETVGASNGQLMGAGNANYNSALIRSLRQSSLTPFSTNTGVLMAPNQGASTSLAAAPSMDQMGGAFSPQVLNPRAASDQEVSDWNAYSTYRTNALNAKTPILSMSEWLAGGKSDGKAPIAPPATNDEYLYWA